MSARLYDRSFTRAAFSAVLWTAAFLFWCLVLPHHLHYQEEIQYFSYTVEHICRYLVFPGGPASYLSEFLVQFFISSVAGAFITALLITAVQILFWRVICVLRSGEEPYALYPFSVVPAVCAWGFLCESGSLVSGVLAVLITLAVWLILYERKDWSCPVSSVRVSAVFLLYWLAGPAVWIYVFLSVVYAFRYSGRALRNLILYLSVSVVTAAVSIAVFRQYPVKQLLLGVGYSFVRGSYTVLWWTFFLSVPVTVSAVSAVSGRALRKAGSVWRVLFTLAVASAGFLFVSHNTDKNLESVYAYDYYALHRDWNSILRLASVKVPVTPPEVTCLNLALVMKGESGDRLLDYHQDGIQGLFPNYDTYIFLKDTGAEALYHAGLLNMAMHYTFEAYQTFPGFRESSRHLKRLAEVNMTAGNRTIAEKYLRKLSHTLFYGGWARRHLAQPDLWMQDAEYARLSAYRNYEPDIYDDMYEFPKQLILRKQVTASGKADAPYHYLLAYDILSKDIGSFEEDFFLADIQGPVPVLYQQVLLLPWLTRGGRGEVPHKELIGDDVLEKARIFLQDIRARRSLDYLKSHYGNTVWYYYAQHK